MHKKRVVILVDSKKRDLMGAALIAHHLEQNCIQAFLEPLQSWQSCLLDLKPDVILFNHLLHSHLCKYTEKLKKSGILVGCLLNEGAFLNESGLNHMSIKHYDYMHCDFFLTWNDLHKNKLVSNEFCAQAQSVFTIGVPRFDFYCKPWSKIYANNISPRDLLINTTFQCAHYYNRTEQEKLLIYSALGGDRNPASSNYLKLIDYHYHSRNTLVKICYDLLNKSDLSITLRPHPREDPQFYHNWLAKLPHEVMNKINISTDKDIADDIINSKVILNCGTCTTALESWIAGKPTLSLVFPDDCFKEDGDKILNLSPIFKSSNNVEDIINKVHRYISNPIQSEFVEKRADLLLSLFNITDGCSSLRAAKIIHNQLEKQKKQPRYPFSLSNLRRTIKVRLLRLINQPGHATPKQILYDILRISSHEKSSIKDRSYFKAIKPSDVRNAMDLIKNVKS